MKIYCWPNFICECYVAISQLSSFGSHSFYFLTNYSIAL